MVVSSCTIPAAFMPCSLNTGLGTCACRNQTTSLLTIAGGRMRVPTGTREALLQAVALLLASCAAAAGDACAPAALAQHCQGAT